MGRIGTIKQARKKIKDILGKMNLVCETDIPRSGLKYSSICQDPEGNYFFFKARMATNPKVEQAFKNEILLTRILNNYFGEDSRIRIPTLLAADFSRKPEWVVFEAVKGRYISLDKLSESICTQVVNALLALRELPTSSLPREIKVRGKIKHYGFWSTSYLWYLRRIKGYLRFLDSDFDNNLRRKIIDLTEASQDFLDGPKVLSHGDFYFLNMLSTKKGLVVFDWEHTRLDLPVADVAYLYVKSQRNRKWAVKIAKRYFDCLGLTWANKMMFQIAVIRYALKFIKDLKILYQEKRVSKSRMNYLLTGIPQCVEKALRGFDELLRP